MANNSDFDKFKGSADYVSDEPLRNAVNVSIALGKPLLIRGEPGTGKTLLAHSIAKGLNKRAHPGTSSPPPRPRKGLRLRHRAAPERQPLRRQGRLRYQAVHQAGQAGAVLRFAGAGGAAHRRGGQGRHGVPQRPLERAGRDELLHTGDQGDHQGRITARSTIITSNAEKELPDAFLRRCIFHYIEFPDPALMEQIVKVHFPDIKDEPSAARR